MIKSQSITYEGITVEVGIQTYRAKMYKSAIFNNMVGLDDLLWEELSIPRHIVTSALWDFGVMSSRCVVKKGNLDFEFALYSDNQEKIKSKFLKFIDSQQLVFIDEIIEAINAMDAPQDNELAPPDDKKK